jgi:hypothetical protein
MHASLNALQNGITVDLRNPEYVDGTISTMEGGVITGPNVRIQAERIIYKHTQDETATKDTVIAECEVRLELMGYLIIGRKLEYDLTNNTGFIYEAKGSVYPWFFHGKVIQICADGSYVIYNGYITTSENVCPEWKTSIEVARLFPNNDIAAENVTVRLGTIPIFYIPKLSLNLDTLCDQPVKYTLRWGGRQGSRIGMQYNFMSYDNFKAYLRLDYNVKRGPGGGIEANYHSKENSERFDTINYFAKDEDPANSHINTRYRFQGTYRRCWEAGRTILEARYDKLSDKMMATDYTDLGIDLEYARRTDLLLHHNEDNWVGNILVRPRINYFQTIKQELPTLSGAILPQTINPLGIITTMEANASYLDFQYASGTVNVQDFTATRLEIRSGMYRPFGNSLFKLTPGASAVGIFYGNRPYKGSSWLATGTASLEGNMLFSKDFSWGRHSVQPYFFYNYIIQPTIPPDKHYIFDITDGWYRVNTMRLGVQQNFFEWDKSCCRSTFFFDSYLWGLFDNKEIPHPLPKLTTNFSLISGETLHNCILATWDLTHGGLAELNFRSAWTVSKQLAISMEYRQRNAYMWRKIDKENFVLDYYRSEDELLHSPVSDRRKTYLLHFFYRVDPGLAFEWKSRVGWDRKHEPFYFEYNFNLLARLPAHWEMKVSYQHKEVDDRFAIYFTLGTSSPKRCTDATCPNSPCGLWY